MKNVHLICNAHLDPVWLWRWEEGCAEALSTFRTAANFIEEFDADCFIFNHNESLLYQFAETHDPELFERIKTYVKAGRWNVIGGWYLQPDCNMPFGESLVRNILTGRKYFLEKLGTRPKVAVNFDSFGHSKGLVQIMHKAGFDSYIICRSGGRNFPFKSQDFIWKGFADSEILVHRSDENYNSVYGKAAEELDKFLERKKEEPVTLFLWGVGNHGGGPSREDLINLRQKMKDDKVRIFHSTPQNYFDELRKLNPDLPVYDGGLNPVAEGCYTSQIRVKQKHRQLENELYSAEKMAASAALQCGREYNQQIFKETTEDLLFSEFHDALPGTSTDIVEEHTLRLLSHGLENMSRERLASFLALTAGQPPVIPDTSVMLIYNPHPYPITGIFGCEMGLPKQNWTKDFFYPEVKMNGERIPTQAEKEISNFGIDWRKRVVVEATLEPSSMNRMDVYFKPIPARPTFEPIIDKPTFEFDNGEMQVEINTATGLVDRFVVDGVDYLKPDSFKLAASDDTYNPWGIGTKSYGRREFQLLTPHEGSAFSGMRDKIIPSVRIIEDGEVRTVVEAVFGLHDSYAYQRYLLPKRGKYFEVETGVYWNEKEQYLKLLLNTPFVENETIGQIPFGHETLRNNSREFVYQKWVCVKDNNTSSTIAVINDGIHGGSSKDGTLGLTLLRSAGYTASADNTGPPYREERYAPRMDQGVRTYRFKIVAGPGEMLFKQIDFLAQVFNEKPYALAYCPSGSGEKPKPLIEIDNTAIILSCFKKAENNEGYIIRLYESEGKENTTNVKLPFAGIAKELKFKPFEVITLRFNQTDKTLKLDTIIEGY